MIMLRIASLGLVVMALSGCGISLPSLSSSLGSRDDDRPMPRQQAGQAKATQTAWWSGFSSSTNGGGKQKDDLGVMASSFSPSEAQTAINKYRAQKGLRPLRLNAKLTAAAKAHSQDLAKNDRISHFGSDGSDIEERARRAGYSFNLIAENVGTGQRTPAEVIRGWQQSPSHNENLLLPDAEEMGIAVIHRPESQYQTFWTLVLGTSS
jgi:uncharacterized protein YkwD